MSGRVLVIAGSDSGGGAGIQADIKTITRLGGYAATAITALTAQDTRGVRAMLAVPAAFVARQIEVVLRDIGADAIKIGMLGDAELIAAVAAVLRAEAPGVPLVLDPVMVAKGGASLLPEAALAVFRRDLMPMASLLTPNIPEATALTGLTIADPAEALEAGALLRRQGVAAVLVKGGHLPGELVVDQLVSAAGTRVWSDPRIDSRHTHGTGCTLASAIAAGLAQGVALEKAIAEARGFVRAAMLAAPGYGKGHGPLGHARAEYPSSASRGEVT
jgi:hydroxymethylpyrimidine/phosphomethylpyrimidine kinase